MKHTAEWFRDRIDVIPYSVELKAYVVGVFDKFVVSPPHELLTKSITIAYADARFSGDFAKFQRLGDWVLWQRSFMPTSSHVNIIEQFGKDSYRMCYVLLRGQWEVYQELAQNLTNVVIDVRSQIVPQV
jgi:hypothetical protein